MSINYIEVTYVAEYFIDRAQKEGSQITPKKLQKMLYYAQAWFLVFEDKKLFNEKIEAWLHGPAICLIYREYKVFGFSPITKEIDIAMLREIPVIVSEFLLNIWKAYGKFDADYLEILAHNEKPWRRARIGVGEFSASKNEIDTRLMKSFYKKLLSGNGK